MFNRYLPEDREAFEALYRPVEDEVPTEAKVEAEEIQEQASQQVLQAQEEPEQESRPVIKDEPEAKPAGKSGGLPGGKPDLKHILKGFGFGNTGIVPLILLMFLVLDVEEDEKLLILALAFVLGI